MIVHDKPAEISLKVSNILQAGVLAVMSWVGLNIQTMGNDIAEIKTDLALNANNITHLESQFTSHISDKSIHVLGHQHLEKQ